MGELPVYTTSAHVFTIDPKTKKTWIPSSSSSVAINYFFDPTKNCYRIVSIEDVGDAKKVVINSTLTEKMTFKKTSQKFGQWTDSKQSTIFGLGFNSEPDLDGFVDQFKKCVDFMKKKNSGDESINVNKDINQIVSGGSGRQWSNRSTVNNNNSRVNSDQEVEKLKGIIEEMQIKHKLDIEQLNDELDRANTGALATSIDNHKFGLDFRTRYSELEQENRELKRRLKDSSSSNLHNNNNESLQHINNQLHELLRYHQKIDGFISQLTSTHSLIGQRITELVTATSNSLATVAVAAASSGAGTGAGPESNNSNHSINKPPPPQPPINYQPLPPKSNNITSNPNYGL